MTPPILICAALGQWSRVNVSPGLLRRIDLRGTDAVGGRTAHRAAARRRRRRRRRAQGPAHRRRGRRAGRRGRAGVRRRRSTVSGPTRVRVPADQLAAALSELDRRRPRRAGGRDRADPRGARRPAPHRHHHHAGPRRHRHRTLGAGRAGRSVRARRQRRLPVQRRDERGARADRRRRFAGDRQPAAGRVSAACRTRRSWPRPRCSASTRCGPSAVRRPWRCWPTAAPTPTGTRAAPVDMITGPGNIYVTAAKRICRSQVGIDAEAGPTEIAILADHTADPVHVAADLISQAEHDEMAASVLVTDSTDLADATDRELAAAAGDHRAPRAGDRGAERAAVGDRARRRRRRRRAHGQRLRRRAPGDPDRRRRRRRGPDPFRRSDFRRPLVAGAAWATTARAPTTCCPPRGAPGTPAACRCRRSCAASTSSTTPRRR